MTWIEKGCPGVVSAAAIPVLFLPLHFRCCCCRCNSVCPTLHRAWGAVQHPIAPNPTPRVCQSSHRLLHTSTWAAALPVCRDAITYSAVISALAKGRQWGAAIELFHHMTASKPPLQLATLPQPSSALLACWIALC